MLPSNLNRPNTALSKIKVVRLIQDQQAIASTGAKQRISIRCGFKCCGFRGESPDGVKILEHLQKLASKRVVCDVTMYW